MNWIERNRWVWSALGVLALWAILAIVTNRFSLQSLSGVAVSASYLAIAALGQMIVVTTGRGNIDLSIANVLTLCAYVGTIVVAGQDSRLPLGLLAVVGIGVVVGATNAALVLLFRIPAIIATLATGYVLATAALFANKVLTAFAISPALKFIAVSKLGGVPVIAVVALLATGAGSLTLNRLVYGRVLSATGQNQRAARLAGVRTDRVIAIAFVLSAVLAALDGLLLGAYVGGAFLDMGSAYLLQSVGAVVLGGSLIMGGASTAIGTLFGCVLLVLIVTTMQIAGLPPGTQDVVQGVVVIGILALAGGRRLRRVRPPVARLLPATARNPADH